MSPWSSTGRWTTWPRPAVAQAGLACLPLSPFFAGAARRPGLLCGYSRLPETMARGAAELIGRVTSDLMAPC